MSGTILITGASSGIGRAAAETFLKGGWVVGLLARRREPLEEIALAHGPAALVLPADVTDPAAVENAVARLVAKGGRLDVLFNNAGMFGAPASIDEVALDDWHQILNVNLNGMFYAARAAFAQMRRQDPVGGRIINNGSISAHVPREGAVGYTVTKHAITGLTRQLSLDGRPHDIACGQIDIGNARTPLLDNLIEKAAKDGTPPPPYMEVEPAADAVWQMANLPLSANVQFMTIMATKMPYIGRG
ncbi:SDR family oxidoreductase [Anianabacter salinae]|uniref:SDR family oxidoreductase n=1 Tax=Anianabacter salinae TaxID=2851023 RepID=UPI00225E5712|nr:SDR family oxidoreductase [Anianabacter salinae]MBV0912998.1 SDR family oxidoreductase [Anianabacter salinae]